MEQNRFEFLNHRRAAVSTERIGHVAHGNRRGIQRNFLSERMDGSRLSGSTHGNRMIGYARFAMRIRARLGSWKEYGRRSNLRKLANRRPAMTRPPNREHPLKYDERVEPLLMRRILLYVTAQLYVVKSGYERNERNAANRIRNEAEERFPDLLREELRTGFR